jgi:2-keto-4-pentenoate hydratase/2-oxohepta-3-ene-1,7-dioic acid hydratase in catechol pathway
MNVNWQWSLAKRERISAENALEYIFGYTCANDVSAGDWQIKWGGSQWSRGKIFGTFAPLGPYIVTADEIPDPNNLQISTDLNGVRVQNEISLI